jgi:dienelactone hydrolase
MMATRLNLRTLVLALALAGVACKPSIVGMVGTSTSPPVFATPTQVPGFTRELRRLYVTLADGSSVMLDAMITRPNVPGRLPLVIISHGTPRDVSERPEMTPAVFAAQSMAFARRGYGVAVVLRRGYGWSEGMYAEDAGRCNNRDYIRSGRVSADDVAGALRTLAREDWVDPTKVLLVGASTGGVASLAVAASNPDGILGVISFAGGRGSDVPDHVCQEERLVYAMGDLGRRSRVPSLWVYAENDRFFGPILAHRMERAYAEAGGRVQFVEVPPFGDDGHKLFSRAKVSEWWALIAPFLGSLGLPTELAYGEVSATVPPPPSLGPEGQQAFADYLASEGFEKAFAAGNSGWGESRGRRTAGDAAERALRTCREHSEGCAVYVIGNARVPDGEAPAKPGSGSPSKKH